MTGHRRVGGGWSGPHWAARSGGATQSFPLRVPARDAASRATPLQSTVPQRVATACDGTLGGRGSRPATCLALVLGVPVLRSAAHQAATSVRFTPSERRPCPDRCGPAPERDV